MRSVVVMDEDIRGSANENNIIRVLRELYEAAEPVAGLDDPTDDEWRRYKAAAKKAEEVLNG